MQNKFLRPSWWALLALTLAAASEAAQEDVGTVIGIDLGTTYSW